MASDAENINKIIDNLKDVAKQSFAQMYACLKARELQTLRQLEAIRKQSLEGNETHRSCVQNIHVSYENESTLIDNISRYGTIDLERLNFDSNTFTLEDYVSPNDDHMYSYKCIEELGPKEILDMEAIEEAALKQITTTKNCVCHVNIRSEDVAKKFRDIEPPKETIPVVETPDGTSQVTEDSDSDNKDSSSSFESDQKKIDPTDDWLNSIKGQTETEPSQVTDLMEHSTITCS